MPPGIQSLVNHQRGRFGSAHLVAKSIRRPLSLSHFAAVEQIVVAAISLFIVSEHAASRHSIADASAIGGTRSSNRDGCQRRRKSAPILLKRRRLRRTRQGLLKEVVIVRRAYKPGINNTEHEQDTGRAPAPLARPLAENFRSERGQYTETEKHRNYPASTQSDVAAKRQEPQPHRGSIGACVAAIQKEKADGAEYPRK